LLNNNAVFVDARPNDDFKAGHLEGAINIPVDIIDDQRRKVMSGHSKKRTYCGLLSKPRMQIRREGSG